MIRENTEEERNMIYEQTAGTFGSDPDAYGLAIMRAEGYMDACKSCGCEFRRHDSEGGECDCGGCSMFKDAVTPQPCTHPNAELVSTTVMITIDKHYRCPDCEAEFTEYGEY
jgi:hypothetical protein